MPLGGAVIGGDRQQPGLLVEGITVPLGLVIPHLVLVGRPAIGIVAFGASGNPDLKRVGGPIQRIGAQEGGGLAVNGQRAQVRAIPECVCLNIPYAGVQGHLRDAGAALKGRIRNLSNTCRNFAYCDARTVSKGILLYGGQVGGQFAELQIPAVVKDKRRENLQVVGKVNCGKACAVHKRGGAYLRKAVRQGNGSQIGAALEGIRRNGFVILTCFRDHRFNVRGGDSICTLFPFCIYALPHNGQQAGRTIECSLKERRVPEIDNFIGKNLRTVRAQQGSGGFLHRHGDGWRLHAGGQGVALDPGGEHIAARRVPVIGGVAVPARHGDGLGGGGHGDHRLSAVLYRSLLVGRFRRGALRRRGFFLRLVGCRGENHVLPDMVHGCRHSLRQLQLRKRRSQRDGLLRHLSGQRLKGRDLSVLGRGILRPGRDGELA